MGDIADDIINQMIDEGCRFGRQKFRGGPDSPAPYCRHCNAPVEWIHSGVRWRMYEPGDVVKLHVCNNAASADEFEDLTEGNQNAKL